MHVAIEPNPVKPGTYRVVLHTGARTTFESFLAHAEGRSTVTGADILAVLREVVEWVEFQAAQGREVDLGPMGRSRLGMKGQFDARPKEIEDKDVRLTIGWVLPRAMKKRLAKAGAGLVRDRVESLPKAPDIIETRAVLEYTQPAPVPDRYVPGMPLCVTGCRLDYDLVQPDEGVYLIAPGVPEIRITTAGRVTPTEILFTMPPDATGAYTLQVRRRHPKQTGPLMSGKLNTPLLPL